MEQLKAKQKNKKKIIIGISVCALCMAIVLGAVIIALTVGGKGAQLYAQKYSWIDSDEGEVTMFEGRYIAGVDGGFVLCQYGRVISKTYASIRPIDEKSGLYSFATFDGLVGQLDKDGKEIQKTERKGEVINDLVAGTGYEFYLTFENGQSLAHYKEKSSPKYSKIYTYSEFNELEHELKLESTLPLGVFVAKTADERTVLSSTENSLEIDIDSIVGFYGRAMVTNQSGSLITYSMPSLKPIDLMRNAKLDRIMHCGDGLAFFDALDMLLVLNGMDEVIFLSSQDKPDSFELFIEGRFILLDSTVNSAVAYDGESFFYGALKKEGEFIKVGSTLLDRNIKKVFDDVGDIQYVTDGENDAYIIDGDVFVVSDKKNSPPLELKLEKVISTYENDAFLMRELALFGSNATVKQYALYYISEDVLYDSSFKKVTSLDGAVLVSYNLLRKNDEFFNFKMKKSIKDVVSFMATDVLGEYLFEKNDGFYTMESKISPKIDATTIKLVLTNPNNDVIIITDNALYHRECVLSFNGAAGILGGNFIYTLNGTSITTYKLERRAIKQVARLSSNAIEVTETGGHGLIFKSDNGMYGFVGEKGKLILAPQYNSIYVLNGYIAVSRNGLSALLFMNGSVATEFKYQGFVDLDGFVLAMRDNNNADLINKSGRAVLSNISEAVQSKNYVYFGQWLVLDTSAKYTFVLSEGYYSLAKSNEV